MKGLLVFLICMFCYGIDGSGAYHHSIKTSIDTPAVIKKIQSDFLVINKQLSLYRKKTRDAPDMSAEGGEVTGYYDKNSLRLLAFFLQLQFFMNLFIRQGMQMG